MPNGICIYLVNIQCLLARLAELSFQLETNQPHVVCIQETWLDETTKDINIPGYVVCSRRDRHAGANRGGILTLRRWDFNGLVHIANCATEERSWHFLKIGIETILVGNWYRPGSSEHDGFTCLYAELAEYFAQVTGVLLVGDLNIHHRRWLHHSNDNTRIGAEMKALCDYHGMFQVVREPTRNEYLLDLACTDIAGSKATVLPKIADHNAVRIDLPIPEIKEVSISRTVWHLKDADWNSLEDELFQIDWQILKEGSAEDALLYFLDILWTLLTKHIPRKQIQCTRSSHPWLNSRCREAVVHKNSSEGSDSFLLASNHCIQILFEGRHKYIEKLKTKLVAFPEGS